MITFKMPSNRTPKISWKIISWRQRCRYMYCQIKYTPEPKPWAYDEGTRRKALQLYVDGMSLRQFPSYPADVFQSI